MIPVIIISGSQSGEGAGMEYRLRRLYAGAVAAAGGLPLLALGKDASECAQLADGLLLAGGMDVDPSLFGEERIDEQVVVQKERDEYEKELFEAFTGLKKPVFGICRGIQAINVFLSGSLWQDLPGQLNICHSETDHKVIAQPGNALFDLFGAEFIVNSFHHQSVNRLGEGLEVLCAGEDGVAEAVRHVSLPVAGVQWHPERMIGSSGYPDMLPLFERFVARCGKAVGDGGYL